MPLKITAYSLAALIMPLMWVVLPNIYETAATSPDVATGHVEALSDHGVTVYVTALEKAVVSFVTPALIVVTVALGAIFMARRFQDREDSRQA